MLQSRSKMTKPGSRTAILALTLALISCGGALPAPTPPVGVVHVVICWLAEPGDPAAREQLIEASRALEEIPGVIRVRAGEVLPSERPIVVSDFDVAVVMEFADAAALAAYLEHPEHQRATREVLRPLTRQVRVYDLTVRF